MKPPPMPPYAPPDGPVAVHHEDADLLAVEKPAGLLTVPGKAAGLEDCLLARVNARWPGARLVHRLDMDTSGIVVFARNGRAQRHLGLQFERRHLHKRYEALVSGEPPGTEGRVNLPLVADWPNRPLQKVCHETGRSAVTDWRVLEQAGSHTRLALVPLTGRSHQLRVHCAALDAPIIGDRFYRGAPADRLMLHATSLRLRTPRSGAWLEIASPAPF